MTSNRPPPDQADIDFTWQEDLVAYWMPDRRRQDHAPAWLMEVKIITSTGDDIKAVASSAWLRGATETNMRKRHMQKRGVYD